MIAKFNLKLTPSWDASRSIISKMPSYSEEGIMKVLEKYALEDGSIDASAIELDWFPEVDAKIFISHAHIDEKLIKSFADYIYAEYGITSFIDSTVWGYADDLIKLLIDRYVDMSNESDPDCTRNRITSFVYILLQSALTKMIDHCECFVFVNTPNSLNSPVDTRALSTRSIWLYNELLMASRIRSRSLESYRQDELRHGDIKLTIPVEMNGFCDLTINDLEKAKSDSLFKDDPSNILETLYYNKGILKR